MLNSQKYTSNVSETKISFNEQLNLLFRATRKEELFRFILLSYNHYDVINRVQNALRAKYQDRPQLRIRVADETYASLIERISGHRGFILIEDFDRLLGDHRIYLGFNQRRDLLTRLPVQLLCFIPEGNEYMRACMENIRDWWSIRNLVLHLEVEVKPADKTAPAVEQKQVSSFGGFDAAGKKEELDRLQARIAELESKQEGSDLLGSLYPQVLEILKDLGQYQKGLEIAERWQAFAKKHKWKKEAMAEIFNSLGTFHRHLGN